MFGSAHLPIMDWSDPQKGRYVVQTETRGFSPVTLMVDTATGDTWELIFGNPNNETGDFMTPFWKRIPEYPENEEKTREETCGEKSPCGPDCGCASK